MSSNGSNVAPQKDPDTQYQHFIPRFVLRSFFDPSCIPTDGSTPSNITSPRIPLPPKTVDAGKQEDNPYVEVQDPSKSDMTSHPPELKTTVVESTTVTPKAKKNKRRRGKKRWTLDVKNPPLHFYDMETMTRSLHYTSRCYGIIDMYRDISNIQDQQHVEKKLSELEGYCAKIVARIVQAACSPWNSSSGSPNSINLTRIERNKLRKFIFVMKYRTPGFFHKYNHNTLATYNSVDKSELNKYMKRRRITNPKLVWLKGLRAILDIEIDAKDKWMQTIQELMFPLDAHWFIFNMTESYMAFVTPENTEPGVDEFILSDCAFGIHEGPTQGPHEGKGQNVDGVPVTGGGEYIEYHKLAPLSPRVLLVLRSNFLHKGKTQAYDELRRLIDEKASPAGKKLLKSPSVFADLDLQGATTKYAMTDSAGRPIHFQDTDVFTFPIERVSSKYVQLFNTVILAEAKASLTWRNDKALRLALSQYLVNEDFKLPEELRYVSGIVTKETKELLKQWEPQLTWRKQLCHLYTMLGGVVPTGHGHHYKGHEKLQSSLLKQSTLRGYFLLGGTADKFPEDFMQSSIISRMRNAIADALPGGDKHLQYRSIVMRNELQFFATLPPQIIFLHCKVWRAGQNRRDGFPLDQLFTEKNLSGNSILIAPDGAEDVLPPLKNKLPQTLLSLLLLQTTLAQVAHQKSRYSGKQITEFTLFGYFGGIRSSWLVYPVEGLFKPEIAESIISWERAVPVERKEFLLEMKVRWEIKKNRVVEKLWGQDIADWVWKWLYYVPDGVGALDSW